MSYFNSVARLGWDEIPNTPDHPGALFLFDGHGGLWAARPAASVRGLMSEIRGNPGHQLRAGFDTFAFFLHDSEAAAERNANWINDNCDPISRQKPRLHAD